MSFYLPEIISNLRICCDRDWLIGYDSQLFWQLTQDSLLRLFKLKEQLNSSPVIFIAETDSYKFLSFFVASIATKSQVFLCNPYWKEKEWQQVFELVEPDLILGNNCLKSTPKNNAIKDNLFSVKESHSLIMIPTGGSSGKIRFAIHDWSTLTASVQGFCNYFSTNTVNSFCLLPLYHVSGLMQFMRSFLTSGKLAIVSYSDLKQAKKNNINQQDFFISLVPTQLQFLLQSQPDWLANFKTILLGGAPPWQSLLDEARKYKLPLAPTYGMTETASQIVTLKPQDFLQGNNSSGRVLPHAQVAIIDENGNLQNRNQVGSIALAAKSLYRGYYGDDISSNNQPLEKLSTDDLGFFDTQGYLYIVGRRSQKIITGGENVFPAEVEAAILATQLVKDVCVIGLPDSIWGQAVVSVYTPVQANISAAMIKEQIEDKLSTYKLPKYWIEIDRLPRNERGKIDYQKIKFIAIDLLPAFQV